MKIEFKNDTYIECIDDASAVKQSKRERDWMVRMSKQIQYWQRNPDKYIEFITGVKLSWYRKVWIRLEFIMRRRIL